MSVDHASMLPSLYGAVLDSKQWQVFCDKFVEVTSSPIMMFGHRVDLNESIGLIGGGFDPAELVRYHRHYADKNPWMHMNMVIPPLTVGVSDMALSRHELFKTEFYSDWLAPQENIVAGPAMICTRSQSRFLAIAAPCRARHVDDMLPRMIEALEYLGPHIEHVIRMARVFAGRDSDACRHSLDLLGCGAILIRRSGEVAHINPLAEKLFEQGGLFRMTYREELASPNDGLAGFIEKAVPAMRNQCFASIPAPLIVRTADGRELMVHANIFPSDIGEEFPGNVWSDPVIGALVVAGIIPAEEATYEDLVTAFGATSAEAKLAAAVIAGQSLYEFADNCGVSRHTVRNQMRALLRKTDTLNQRQFVRKILSYVSPIVKLN